MPLSSARAVGTAIVRRVAMDDSHELRFAGNTFSSSLIRGGQNAFPPIVDALFTDSSARQEHSTLYGKYWR
jgi:hypothetical protein